MLYGWTFQNILLVSALATPWSYNPSDAVTSPVWAIPRSLATTGGIIVYFLFLQVLRCFSSLRWPPTRLDNTPSRYWVVPFGNLRIKGHLHLPEACRSLSRPSSPPRAKASAMCPYLLFVLPITYGRYILSAFNFTFFWSHHVKERCFNYKTIIKTEWRITDSNR